MSNQIDRNPTPQDHSAKKWSVLRSRTVPANVKLNELDEVADSAQTGQRKTQKKVESVPAALHTFPRYSEGDSRLLKT